MVSSMLLSGCQPSTQSPAPTSTAKAVVAQPELGTFGEIWARDMSVKPGMIFSCTPVVLGITTLSYHPQNAFRCI